ncbi:nucleoside monophosphate kinase [symbiont of Argiope bruennichi]|uniref:adenylate kinase family protein n=1 Tax=symbiont of Argiope bruennichi TaxID=2810479 RepID=UPI003DA4022B
MTDKNNLILFFGAPGCGKGTAAKFLKQQKNYFYYGCGDFLRKKINSDKTNDFFLQDIIKNGKLVPDSLICSLYLNNLEQNFLDKENIILDGFPRTLFQAKYLKNFCEKNNFLVKTVVFFDISLELAKKRILSRLVCKSCGAIYNDFTNKPKKENICDLCGGEVAKRIDDNEKVFQERFLEFQKNIQSILNFYQEENIKIKKIVILNDDLKDFYQQLENI